MEIIIVLGCVGFVGVVFYFGVNLLIGMTNPPVLIISILVTLGCILLAWLRHIETRLMRIETVQSQFRREIWHMLKDKQAPATISERELFIYEVEEKVKSSLEKA
jgi:hypothetical protein